MAEPTILIIGATGTTGNHLVRQFLAKNINVRILVRDVVKGIEFTRLGAQVMKGDLADVKSLEGAMAEIKKVFLLSGPAQNQAELQGNAVDAAKKAGVKHVVKLSAYKVKADSPISLFKAHADIEKKLAESGMSYTNLRPHYFMQNFFNFAGTIKGDGAFYAPMKSAKISMVDVRDVAAVAWAVLTEDGHNGKTYDITGPEAITFDQAAETLSKVLGKKVKYVNVPPDAAKKAMMEMQMPEWLVDDLIKLYDLFSSGQGAEVAQTTQKVGKITPRNFETFVKDHIANFK